MLIHASSDRAVHAMGAFPLYDKDKYLAGKICLPIS